MSYFFAELNWAWEIIKHSHEILTIQKIFEDLWIFVDDQIVHELKSIYL